MSISFFGRWATSFALVLLSVMPFAARADDDPLFAQVTFDSCDISGKVAANAEGVVSYNLNGACSMLLGPTEAFNDFFNALAQWNPKTNTATEVFTFDDGRKATSTSVCVSNPWAQATTCSLKTLSQPIPITGIVLPPYPLSASLMDSAQRFEFGTKTKSALLNPSSLTPPPPPPPPPPLQPTPSGCKHFLGRANQLLCMTDAGQAACVELRKQKKIDACVRAGAKEQNLFAMGCTNFLGRADDQLCNGLLGYQACEKARLAGKMKVCTWMGHPESALPGLGCTKSGAKAWACPTSRGVAACEGAKKKGTTNSCTKK
jgi:hypothetical protein